MGVSSSCMNHSAVAVTPAVKSTKVSEVAVKDDKTPESPKTTQRLKAIVPPTRAIKNIAKKLSRTTCKTWFKFKSGLRTVRLFPQANEKSGKVEETAIFEAVEGCCGICDPVQFIGWEIFAEPYGVGNIRECHRINPPKEGKDFIFRIQLQDGRQMDVEYANFDPAITFLQKLY